jgi:hypothetical protein
MDEIVSRLRRVESCLQPTAEEMLALGEIVYESNQDRTARGVDAKGRDFQEYSERYAAYKAKHGCTADVDLIGVERHGGKKGKSEAHPHMLTVMEVWSSGEHEVKIGFKDKASRAARVALAHIKGCIERHLPVRRFLGLTMDDRAAVLAKRAEQIQDRLKGMS